MSMNKIDKKQKWIEAGYALFAQQGPKGLKVKVLAQKVGINKSSFYHFFSNAELFTTELFDYHLQRSQLITQAAKACQQLKPDLLNMILEYKQDVLFHKQLRIHREQPNYKKYIQKAHAPVEKAFLKIWAKVIHLEDKLFLAEALLQLFVDNFYMRITDENMNYDWLLAYLTEIASTVKGIQRNSSREDE